MKYKQKGYQDDERPPRDREFREKKEQTPGAPRTPMSHDRPRSPVMPGRRGVSRCAGCGNFVPPSTEMTAECPKCHMALHSCKQCVNFDTSARFECIQRIPVRVAKKDQQNDCTFYEMKITVEKETSSAGAPPPSLS